jgi:hypothetical protein
MDWEGSLAEHPADVGLLRRDGQLQVVVAGDALVKLA